MINKYTNQQYSGDVPLKTGDRRYAQDRIRDFWYSFDKEGLVFADMINPTGKFIASGGVVSKGSGDTLDITAGVGYAPFSVYIPDAWTTFPPSKIAADVAMARIAWGAQTNMAVTGATLNGASVNYVKVKYAETDSNTRQRAKASGVYSYEVVPGYTFTVNTTAPTDYEVCLATFIGTTGGSFTFSTTLRTGMFFVISSFTEITSDQTLAVNSKYIINATARLNLTLPSTAAKNDKITIVDRGFYGYKILQNSGQQIFVMGKGTVPGTTGYFQSKIGLTTIVIECITTDTTWQVTQTNDVWKLFGIIGGGNAGASNFLNSIAGFDFSLETAFELTATLSVSKQQVCGVASFNKCYFMGGNNTTGPRYNSIDAFVFSAGTCSTISATLSVSKNAGSGIQNDSKGYMMGGDYSPTYTKDIERLNFATESCALLTATLTASRSVACPISGLLKGYVMGGFNGSAGMTTIDYFKFSDETCTAITATLNTSRYFQAGVQKVDTKGYAMGGSASTNTIEDLKFSDESSTIITATLTENKSAQTGISGFSMGYFPGSITGINIERFSFFNEASSNVTDAMEITGYYRYGSQGYIG